jgi:hypothetical protein
VKGCTIREGGQATVGEVGSGTVGKAVLRRAVLGALLALVLVSPAGSQPVVLMPGVTYDKQLQFTFHGPTVMHVLTMPRPGGLWDLEPVLSNDAIVGTETLTAIERRATTVATVAGINADRFNADGRPTGMLLRKGVLDHGPNANRSSIGIDSAGALRVEKVRLLPTWQGTGNRQTLAALNGSRSATGTSLYTPVWGPVTPAVTGSLELVLRPFGATIPNTEVAGEVVEVRTGGGTPIPPDGAVLVARGTTAVNRMRAEAPLGTTVRIRLILDPDWAGVADAVGAGPALVRAGKAIFDAKEEFLPSQLAVSEPRTAVGQLADGRIVLVVVDGRRPGYSTGMTTFELALALLRLGAVNAAALDGGGSSTMAFEGRLLNRPSGNTERRVSDVLLVGYTGIQAPAPSVGTLSPNGDGFNDIQSLAFKVVRTSSVSASLVGPDGVARTLASGPVAPGTYSFTWAGTTADGVLEPEGPWRWSVSATDDLGRPSSFERSFSLNTTLGFGRGLKPALSVPRRLPKAVAEFTLSRAAQVASRIETTSGTVVRSAEPPVSLEPGQVQVTWDGRTDKGAVVHSGTYVARMTARNDVGSAGLTARFSVRRTGSGKGSGDVRP